MVPTEILLPPLVGAVIGYVTNALAIRMLFRPLQEKRVGPIRIPFTPGVIPRQRDRLATSLGRMTSREFFTEDALKAHLNSPEFRVRLQAVVRQRLGEWLARPLSQFLEELPDRLPHWSTLVGKVVRTVVQRLLDLRLEDVLKRFPPGLETSSPIPREGGSPSALCRGFASLVGGLVLEEARSWLEDPQVRDWLHANAQRLIGEILDDLDPLQRLVVSALRYEDRIRRRVTLWVAQSTTAWDRHLHQSEFRAWLEARLAQAIHRWLLGGAVWAQLGDILAREHREHPGRTLGELLRKNLGEGNWEGLWGLLPSEQQDWSRWFLSSLERWKAWGVLDQSLATLYPELEEDIEDLSWGLTDGLLRGLEKDITALLAAVDIQALVENKVRSMDLEQVESLLVQVMDRHLRWINIFGAILGLVLGLVQVAWRVLETLVF